MFSCFDGAICDIEPKGCNETSGVDKSEGVDCPIWKNENHLTEYAEENMDDSPLAIKFENHIIIKQHDTVYTKLCDTYQSCEGEILTMDYFECNGYESCIDRYVVMNITYISGL